jgi:hypothetical protein
MTNEQALSPVQKLRDHVAHLEAENRRLRGQHVPSEAAVALQRENAELRRRLAGETPRASGRAGGEYLTLPEVAQTLNVSTYEILRDLRDSLPMALDDKGNTVIAKRDLDAFLLARAQGRPTRRFL